MLLNMTQHTLYKKPRLAHKFRFQLLYRWLAENFEPCKAADVGGGKGLLAFLLNSSGWNVTVIDPFDQILPRTFVNFIARPGSKNLDKKRTTLKPEERAQIKRINKPFEIEMAKDFDLLVGLHSHGSNMKIIGACAATLVLDGTGASTHGKSFVLLPCCVIDEPVAIAPNINWFDSLVDYAKFRGFDVGISELNFAGQNKIIYSR